MRATRLEPLLVIWLATLSVDRLDLLGGAANFVLTPYLALTPLVILLAGIGVRYGVVPLEVPQGLRPYALLLCALVGLILLSAVLGLDPTMGARRSAHFLAVSGGTLFVALVLTSAERRNEVLARGAELGLALTLLVSLLTAWALVWQGSTVVRVGPATLDLTPAMYGRLVPRLSGTVVDPNRAGLDILFFLFVLARWGRPGLRRRFWMGVGIAMALMTLSRSFLFAAAALSAAALLSRGPLHMSRASALAILVVPAFGAGLLLARPDARAVVAEAAAPVSSRFSIQEQSTRDHLRLLARGLDEGTKSVRRAALGVGYGNAYLVLQDVFPDNKYGNFHSFYVTLLAECGVFALLAFLVLVARPLVRIGPLFPMVAALVAFNVFYQAGNGPLLWTVLSLAWLLPRSA